MNGENNVQQLKKVESRLVPILFGGFLILIGLLFLLTSLFNIHVGAYLWPFFMIIPGLFLIGYAMMNEVNGEAAVIIGSIFTAIGLLLLFQIITGFWASWAYAWALVAPTAVGLGLMLWGMRFNREESIKSGKDLTRIGLILFIAFGVFFELIIGISGFGMARYVWPLLIIGLGLWVLAKNLRPTWH
ncbi:MAG: hypothetical protein KC423_08035 [Anaerolineales bacterium]|nr:hypothetical protein [Anaerolineales bacterium]